jgi:branched-chain amino acid transport system permease protein
MEHFLSNFIPTLIVGLSLGSLFGLVGVAFTVIINASQLVNFGQGDYAMFGVAVCWYFVSILGWPLWAAFLAATVCGGLLGVLTNYAIVSPLLKRPEVHEFYPILGTMAVGIIAAGAVGVYTKYYWMPIDRFFGKEPWTLGGFFFDAQGLIIIAATLILVFCYWLLLNKTLIGAALRATGFNREVSILLGIRTSSMVGLSFFISGVIAAVAGVLCAPLSAFTAKDGLPLAVNGFIALIVGGWGNPYASVLGGITLGLLRAWLTGYFSSAHAELGTFFVLMIVLTLKPNGLFAGFMIPKIREE